MRILWTRLAVDDLEAIRRYIEPDQPRAALRVVRQLVTAVERLAGAPAVGRPGRVMNTRELVLVTLPYVIAYRVTAGVVEVLRVLHTSRRWPTRLK